MKIGQQFKSVVINHQSRSLYSLIADGKYRATSLGRNTWKKLIGSRASLQTNCNKEGFNAICTDSNYSKARIGIIGNNEDDCSNCDSRSALALEDTTMTPTRVATSTSKLWDTSWFNKFCNTRKEPSNGLKL